MARVLCAPEDLCLPGQGSVSLVIGANEFLLLDQVCHNFPIESRAIFRIWLAKPFKLAMPTAEVAHPIAPNALALQSGLDAAWGLPQKPPPDSLSPKNVGQLNSLPCSNPEPSVDDEPRRRDSLGCPLHLGDDFLRHRSRSLLIARKVH